MDKGGLQMVADTKTVNDILSSYVADVKKEMPIDKVYLFGSYAKGNPHENSDLDICFFSDYYEDRWVIDVGVELLRIAEKYNRIVDIEPHSFATSEINDGNPFIEEILRTGIELR
jgi:predicted nucleotidyltransferase